MARRGTPCPWHRATLLHLLLLVAAVSNLARSQDQHDSDGGEVAMAVPRVFADLDSADSLEQWDYEERASSDSTSSEQDRRYPISVARVYSTVNENRPKEYLDYKSYTPKWGSSADYALSTKLGRGRYSSVYKAVHIATGVPCVLKLLKQVRQERIKREVRILEILRGGPNIVELYETVKDEANTPALVMEYVDNANHKELYPTLTDYDIRYYIYQLLVALDYAHSHGIMHRDVKPQNIMIDHKRRQLRLADWGLAEFYRPGQNYHVSVASRHYKGPELLVDMHQYDYSLDMWSVGCVLGSMLFHDLLFNGADNDDQLVKITEVLGTDELYAYLDKYGLVLNSYLESLIQPRKKKPWSSFITEENWRWVNPDAIDFLSRILRYDHQERLTAKEAMQHPYFQPVRASLATMAAISESKTQSQEEDMDVVRARYVKMSRRRLTHEAETGYQYHEHASKRRWKGKTGKSRKVKASKRGAE